MKKFSEIFREKYYDRLITPNNPNHPVRNRADSLLLVFQKLEAMDKTSFYIVETGTMREEHGEENFSGDGCSTIIFSDFLSHVSLYRPFLGGKSLMVSVDINQKNVEYCRSKVGNEVDVICDDSVNLLYSINQEIKFDLIYLDSYDIEQHNPHPSQLHHLKELCAVMKNTRKGTIIVVDDHDAFFTGGQIGKGNYVKDFLLNIGAIIIYEGYQIVFEI